MPPNIFSITILINFVNWKMAKMTGICVFYKMELLYLYNNAACKQKKSMVS